MKKELHIPRYKDFKESGSVNLDRKTFSYIAIGLLVTVIVFGGISLKGLTGYDVFENFPVSPSPLSYYENDPFINRGTNAVTEIDVTPYQVIAGGAINIKINPGIDGAWERMKIYYWGGNIESTKECGKGVLKDNNVKLFSMRGFEDTSRRRGFKVVSDTIFAYQTSASWSEGRYAVAVFDYNFNDWICEPFVVYRLNSRSEDINRWGGLNIINPGG